MTTSVGPITGPRLDPRIAVLTRPSGAVQLGWHPETALVLRPPPGVTATALAGVLRLLDGGHSPDQVAWQANLAGIGDGELAQILAELEAADVLVRARREPVVRSVHLHGRGPLADRIAAALRGRRVHVGRSAPDHAADGPPKVGVDCVVLTDELVPEPRTVADLMAGRIAHLSVRMRDGRGVVGPLVLPGRTSCLRCADLTRTDRDPEWPHIAAQLLGRVGYAGPEAVLATAALAVSELTALIDGDPHRSPTTVDTTIELDVTRTQLLRRRWQRHPRCECRDLTRDVGEDSDRRP
ncbi:TOMM precursor leader peptide-binding protein [Rhodococcus sp. NPDC003318]|uniref:TOMM precursor leader peptide-binding protein n=1 Tax=Rhodococcus sp. NPDC003318 TaxID=3364503 RepID=UPI0036969085